MATKYQELRWKLNRRKNTFLLIWGLKNGLITPYDDELIEKLRNIYYGGIPASVILLSDGMTNGHCYDRALLMSRVFLDEEDDINLLYATIDSLKLNPKFICDDPLTYDHCIVERITKEGEELIYDTSSGLIYDKKMYWLMEHPKIRKVNNKESIIKFINEDEEIHPENVERDKYIAPLILPFLEKTFGKPNEMYTMLGMNLLKREIEHYKNKIHYTDMIEEIRHDMKQLGFKS